MTTSYQPDILGPDFEQLMLPQPPDYEGTVLSTLVRRRPTTPATRAVLYVHGFNDYFFQREMAARYHEHGYHFYALDLRKYGRSWLPHQRPNNVRDLREYFADLDAALAVIKAEGHHTVLLSGHSTGGLVTALYAREGQGRAAVSALFLNSPFLALHLPKGVRHLAMSMAAVGRIAPDLVIPGTRLTTYGESLHRQHRGEWDYHLPWKPVEVFPVNAGWLRAIAEGHRRIRGGVGLEIPVLLLHADRTVQARGWSEEYFQADGVLNVRDMQALAPRLGKYVTIRAIAGGIHDLMLSRQPARDQAYRELFAWLATTLGQ